jgi:hypothetical protein
LLEPSLLNIQLVQFIVGGISVSDELEMAHNWPYSLSLRFFFVHTIEQIFRLKTQRATRLHEWTAIINLWVFA